MHLVVKEGVVLKNITPNVIDILDVVLHAQMVFKTALTVTGIQGDFYPKGKSHDLGLAVDIRKPGLLSFEQEEMKNWLENALRHRGYNTVVLWDDEEHKDHWHVGASVAGI